MPRTASVEVAEKARSRRAAVEGAFLNDFRRVAMTRWLEGADDSGPLRVM